MIMRDQKKIGKIEKNKKTNIIKKQFKIMTGLFVQHIKRQVKDLSFQDPSYLVITPNVPKRVY